MSEPACFRPIAGGLLVDVRLTPRGARDAVDGSSALSDGRRVLLARVRAVPEKGAANAALEALMADALGVPRSIVAITSGHTARVKTIRLLGDPAALAARIAKLAGG